MEYSPILTLPPFIYDYKNELICFYHVCNCSSNTEYLGKDSLLDVAQCSDTGFVTRGSMLHLSSRSEPAEQPGVGCKVGTNLAHRAQDLQQPCALLEEQTQRGSKERPKCSTVGKTQVPHCQVPPKAAKITYRKRSPYICSNLPYISIYLSKSVSRNPSPFIMPLFMFVQVLIIPSCKGLMHLQKPASAFIYKTFVCLHFQDSTCFARHLCGTWGTQKINITAIRDKISDQRPLLAATKVSESSSSYRHPGHHSKTGQSSAV